ncbi:MAG: bifunctional hydroxymethylpyrimidine kinase/phosphomethylpyrimidine kinase, partial [Clostridia bacterium]|nr:bifunctional hydroxymethylpyrimidine kinase/phosphomethylpyrimidine kinase [Clostridia bacterium]
MKNLKKMAAINDLSGSDRCSLTVAIPIITAMGIHCCAMPTAILSNHTGYAEYFFDDYTDKMPEFTEKWQKRNLKFDAIYTGFLGSEQQIQIVEDFIQRFAADGTGLIVDPVMGDNGKIYTTYTPAMCREMKKLVSTAHVVTPNVTEACQLADVEYSSEEIDDTF